MTTYRSSVAGVILAAGLSSRYNGNKLLAPLKGKPLIQWVAEAALASKLDRIVAVFGHEKDKARKVVSAILQDPRFDYIDIDDYQSGQSRSVIAGLMHISRDYAGTMYLMGDQPLIDPAIIDEIITTFENSDKGICYPSFNGKRRNPVIFGEKFYPDILALTGDTGARQIIDSNPDSTVSLEYQSEIYFRDVDREIDLQSLVLDEKNSVK
ncbi:MAG: hypothetical protein CMM74_13620 [Rhodospirillaceae bacterium]|nr:hypothetical protein [Rhodospirillaceae bacterium]